MTQQTDAILRAAESAGSQAALARLLGVTPSAVNQWACGVRPIPAEQCPVIEHATGVCCEELRPDVNWAVLRKPARITTQPELIKPSRRVAKAGA